MTILLCIWKFIVDVQHYSAADDPDESSGSYHDIYQGEDPEVHVARMEINELYDDDHKSNYIEDEVKKSVSERDSEMDESVSGITQQYVLDRPDLTEGVWVSPSIGEKEQEPDSYNDHILNLESSLNEDSYNDFSDSKEEMPKHAKRESPENLDRVKASKSEEFSSEFLTRSLEIFPFYLGNSAAGSERIKESGYSESFDEEKYLAAYQNIRSTRVWNLAYLDEAAIYEDTPILYDMYWFWIRWAKKILHFLQSRHMLLTAPQSMDSSLRSAQILPFPILREASKLVSFIMPDGHVANHKNLAPLIDRDVCAFPSIKVVIHLYSNHTQAEHSSQSPKFLRKYLNRDILVYPANPFQNIAWGNDRSENPPPEKWMKLLLKAARQLYVMLLIDSAAYSQYKHDLYTFLWNSIDNAVENPPLSSCKCSMFYVSPFESEKENISIILDDSIPISISETEELLPMKIGPQRDAQTATLTKEYYAVMIQLIDVMSRIQSNIDAQFVIHSANRMNTLVPHLHSALGRIVPGVSETIQDKMNTDATDYYQRKEEFMRENGIFIDPSLMPPARFENSYPMMHFSFVDERPSIQQIEEDEPYVDGIRPREFGPLTFCGFNYFRKQNRQKSIDFELTSGNESYEYAQNFTALSALKLSAPLGPAYSSMHLDIICPCVQSLRKASILQTVFSNNEAELYHRNKSIEAEIRHVSKIGSGFCTSEYAIFGSNCYAIWDPMAAKENPAPGVRSDASWALSLKDRSMILPEMEKQVKIDGWRWKNETRNFEKLAKGGSRLREYKFILEGFYSHSSEQVVRANANENFFDPMKNAQVTREIYQRDLASPYLSLHRSENYGNSTMLDKRILNSGQVLPCINQCSTKFSQNSEMRFFSESCMCKVGVFTEMSKRWTIGPENETDKDNSASQFHLVPSVEKNLPKKTDMTSIDIEENRKAIRFQDPYDAISLLNAQTMMPVELPEKLLVSLSEEVNDFLGHLSNSTNYTKKNTPKKELLHWFRRVLDVNNDELPEFVKKILPHTEIIPDPHSPFKKNVICIPPNLNFHWNLQRGEIIADNDTIYAKSVKQFYRHMHERGWSSEKKNTQIGKRRAMGIKKYFMNEARQNHFLFSHHSVERIFNKLQANHTSFQDRDDLVLPILPKDPFAQAVLPFPETISGWHDLSEIFHPYSFPRSTKQVAHDLFLSDDTISTTDTTLMEKIVPPMIMLSFMKHISTVALGIYFYDMLHPELPCTSVMYSDSRNFKEYATDSEFISPSFLGSLPTKNDIFVTLDGDIPTTMLVPPENEQSIKLDKQIKKEYPDLFARHLEFLFLCWNTILRDSSGDECHTIDKAFEPPLFLDFPKQSWVFSDDHSSSKIMPLLQEVLDPANNDMILVNVYCLCEPLRDSAWTLMGPSCVRLYRSQASTYLYAQNPATKEYFVIDNYDGLWRTVYNIKSPVKDKYFGYMPQSFSTKNKFSTEGNNSTLPKSSFTHFHPFDRRVIPLSGDQVHVHSPCPCASICEPLKLIGNPSDGTYQQTFFRKLFANNFCQVGVTVMN